MKILIVGKYHHKNDWFLREAFRDNLVNNIKEADVVFSAATYINTQKYPNKIFIFGPHFSVLPNPITNKLSNECKNAIYIQPSQPCADLWEKELNYKALPIKGIPFGVDSNKFINDLHPKTEVIVYYKHRDPSEKKYLMEFLKNKEIKPIFIKYGKYHENDYLNYLKKAKYMIVLDAHESQGFAIQEALSCNVPLLVWSVNLMKQEYGSRDYNHLTTKITSIPYWDERCGEFFYNKEDLETTFDKFISKLDSYKPRDYILENLSVEKCKNRFLQLIEDIKKSN